MKVVVTASGKTLDAKVDPRFGRCAYFLVVETDDLSFEAIDNENAMRGGGAGIQSAQLIAQQGAKKVLTGNCGPNAFQTLAAAGVEVIIGCSGTVSEVIERFKSGELNAVDAPNVDSHAGLPGGGGGGGRGRGW